jgi:hypothetical protein
MKPSHLKLVISVAAVALIVVHHIWPEAPVSDPATLGLALLAVLPWLSGLVESAELPGGIKLKFWAREVQKEQDRQRKEIDTLKFLLVHFVTKYEIMHLTQLASDQPFLFTPSPAFGENFGPPPIWWTGS